MTRHIFAVLPVLFVVNCGNEAPAPPAATSTTTGESTGMEGTTSSSESTATVTSSGVSSTTTGSGTVSTSAGPTTGQGGAATSTVSTDGATTTMGGSSMSSMTSDTSSSSSTGGAATTDASSSGGTTSTTGSTGAGGTGTTGGGDLSDVMSELDGSLLTFPCGTGHSGYDCDNIGCVNNQVTHEETFNVGGEAGVVYNVTFRIRGIVEGYQYQGGTRDQGTTSQTTSQDLFYQGGQPKASGADGFDYNTYELEVSPPVDGAANTYYLNSIPVSPHDASANHLTFPIDYSKTIPVTGGGTVHFSTFDSNCKQVMNCGPTAGNSCMSPASVSLAGADPAAPSDFMQPFQQPAGAYGQWVFFDVTEVTAQ